MHKLKENLRNLAQAQNISIAQLARETGVAPQTLNNWLAGADPRSLTQVKTIAEYFSVSLDELCFGESAAINSIKHYQNGINIGVFEVILKRIKKEE